MKMKIRDNETGEVFEYGTNIHHALRISRNGGCLMFENLQNGDGSLYSGDGGYSFVLDDGKTPEESIFSPDSFLDSYANIGGFHKDNKNNNGWIPVEERLPEKNEYFTDTSSNKEFPNGYYRRLEIAYMTDTVEYIHGYYDGYKWMDKYLGAIKNVVAWRIHEPYRPERNDNV